MYLAEDIDWEVLIGLILLRRIVSFRARIHIILGFLTMLGLILIRFTVLVAELSILIADLLV